MQNMQNKKKKDKLFTWILISQSIVLLGTGIVFPFYIIFIKEIGGNFTDFGIAYAIFSLSSAVSHALVGTWSDVVGRKIFLLINSWGTAVLFLFFPIVTALHQVFVLQMLLGVFGAMYRTSEKALIGDITHSESRGKVIGVYHGWTSVFAALAVIIGGYLIDIFTLSIIFYIGSILLFISGFAILKITDHTNHEQ